MKCSGCHTFPDALLVVKRFSINLVADLPQSLVLHFMELILDKLSTSSLDRIKVNLQNGYYMFCWRTSSMSVKGSFFSRMHLAKILVPKAAEMGNEAMWPLEDCFSVLKMVRRAGVLDGLVSVGDLIERARVSRKSVLRSMYVRILFKVLSLMPFCFLPKMLEMLDLDMPVNSMMSVRPCFSTKIIKFR